VTGRRKRLSADLPQHWLHAPEWFCLSDRAWRLHTHALMWAIGRTDGFIPEDMLGILIRGTWEDLQGVLKELATAGHWEMVPGGWQVTRWELSQSTVEEIENNRRRERNKKRRQRASQPPRVPGGTPSWDSRQGVRHGKRRH
jgi:hypothetical protein